MSDRAFAFVDLAGLTIFLLTIYGPSIHRYRRSRFVYRYARGIDYLLDGLAVFGWQFMTLIYATNGWPGEFDYHLPVWASLSGVILLLIALVLLRHAYRVLEDYWSPTIEVREDHHLITSGVYSYLRHPIYTALLLWTIAQPLLLHNWVAGFAMAAAYIPLLALRIPHEEQMMASTFGPLWREYSARTGRLLPRIGHHRRVAA